MADVILTIKIMPEGVETDLGKLEINAKKICEKYGRLNKTEIVPVAFGLKSLIITMLMDEDKGSTEPLEKELAELKNVSSAEITNVSRALG